MASQDLKSRTRYYMLGLTSGYFVRFVSILIGLWLTPFTLTYLARDEFGLYTLGSNLIMWLSLVDLGITAGLNVHLAQKSSKPAIDEISQYASSTFFAQLGLVAIIIVLGVTISLLFPDFFEVRPELYSTSIVMMLLLIAGTATSFATHTFSAILIAYQQIHVDNLIRFGLLVIRTALTVILLIAGWGIISLALANVIATVITSGLAIVRVYRLLPGIKINRKLVSWDILKAIGSTGIWFSLGSLAGLVIENVDNAVAGKLVSLEAVTVFSLTGRLYYLAQGLLNQIANTARPGLGQMIGAGKKEQALKTYRQIFALSTGIAIVACFGIWAGNEAFIKAWVGDENFGGQALSLAFGLNLLVNVWIIPNRAVLSSSLIVRPQALSRLVEGALNLGLSILLTLRFGLVGVAISTALAAFMTSFWYLPYLTAKAFDRPFGEFLKTDALRICIAGLCLIPVSLIMRNLSLQISGYIGAIIGMVGTGLIGLVFLWFIVFDRMLRLRILTAMRQLLTRVNEFIPVGAFNEHR